MAASTRPARPDDALPVLLELQGPDADRIRRHLEGELGWQPVETDGLVRAVVRIVDVPAAACDAGVPARGVPTWLVVTDADPVVDAARAAGRVRAVEVVRWPPGDGAFAAAAARLGRSPVGAGGGEELRVGGAAGGVGCTTVALTVAGISAWAGRRTLVVTHGAVPHPVERSLEPDALASPDLARVARPVRGVPGLGLVHVAAPAPDLTVRIDGHEVVRDVGTATAVDLLVVRRDGRGLAAVGETTAGTVLVSDSGPLPVDAFRRAAGGRRLVVLPWSTRVARAAVLGRVPASLPGRWVRLVAEGAGRRPQPQRDGTRPARGPALR